MLGHQTCSVLLFFQPLTSFISFCFFSLIYLFRVEEGFELSLSEHVHISFALLLQLCKLHRKECLNLVQRIIHFENILHNMSFLKLLSISCRSNGIFFYFCMFLRMFFTLFLLGTLPRSFPVSWSFLGPWSFL